MSLGYSLLDRLFTKVNSPLASNTSKPIYTKALTTITCKCTLSFFQLQSLLPNLPRQCVPEEQDKLSEQEIQELVVELMKTFDAAECTNDPYMSPMLATPEMLTGLPPIHLVVCYFSSVV